MKKANDTSGVTTPYTSDSDMGIAFYDSGNYANHYHAQDCGALYRAASEISLYGDSGLHDLHDIVVAMKDCLGNTDLVCCVWHQADYVELDELIGLKDLRDTLVGKLAAAINPMGLAENELANDPWKGTDVDKLSDDDPDLPPEQEDAFVTSCHEMRILELEHECDMLSGKIVSLTADRSTERTRKDLALADVDRLTKENDNYKTRMSMYRDDNESDARRVNQYHAKAEKLALRNTALEAVVRAYIGDQS